MTDALQGISGGDFGRCELLELDPYSREYLQVFYDFGKSMGYDNVIKIMAVQNPRLWMAYTMYVSLLLVVIILVNVMQDLGYYSPPNSCDHKFSGEA